MDQKKKRGINAKARAKAKKTRWMNEKGKFALLPSSFLRLSPRPAAPPSLIRALGPTLWGSRDDRRRRSGR
jgi:hypothetical protein